MQQEILSKNVFDEVKGLSIPDDEKELFLIRTRDAIRSYWSELQNSDQSPMILVVAYHETNGVRDWWNIRAYTGEYGEYWRQRENAINFNKPRIYLNMEDAVVDDPIVRAHLRWRTTEEEYIWDFEFASLEVPQSCEVGDTLKCVACEEDGDGEKRRIFLWTKK